MGNDKPEPEAFLPEIGDAAGPLSDRVVDGFLTAVRVTQPERTQRIRRAFVRRLIQELHPTPVLSVERLWSFGRWIEAIRRSVRLEREDVAIAIDVQPVTIERLERSNVLPWTLGTALVADLVCLFRLHISAVEQLFAASNTIVSGHHGTNAVARSSALDAATRGESARRALDLYLAASSQTAASTQPLEAAVESLRQELARRGAQELLGPAK